MATLTFTTKRVPAYQEVNGVGSFVVSVNFTPNFIDVRFSDIQNKNPLMPDSFTWDLAATATGYDLTVNYNTSNVRTIKAVVSKLSVDPEQSISFGS